MYMANVVSRTDDTATFELGITLQLHLELYVEPVADDPTTHEDEKKQFVLDQGDLEDLVAKAKKKASELQHNVFRCMGYEAAGLTYKEVSVAHRGEASEDVADKPYTASEDLQFLYVDLHQLWDFIFEAECILL